MLSPRSPVIDPTLISTAAHYTKPETRELVALSVKALAQSGGATYAHWLNDLLAISQTHVDIRREYCELRNEMPGLTATLDEALCFVELARELLREHDAANGFCTGVKQPDSLITKRLRDALALLPERPERKPFCVCGRRLSECDGSREGCVARQTVDGAF